MRPITVGGTCGLLPVHSLTPLAQLALLRWCYRPPTLWVQVSLDLGPALAALGAEFRQYILGEIGSYA